MRTLEAETVPDNELDRLDELVETLPTSSDLRMTLTVMSAAVRNGTDVLLNTDAELTPAVAAKFLSMSRTHLYKLMDAGDLPFVHVGRDRRIGFADLVAFAGRRDAARKDLAEEFGRAGSARDRARGRF